jgi:hypothetical protein
MNTQTVSLLSILRAHMKVCISFMAILLALTSTSLALATPALNPTPTTYEYWIHIQNYKQYPKAVAVGVIGGPCSSDQDNHQITLLTNVGALVPVGTKLTIGLFDNTKCTGEPLLSTSTPLQVSDQPLTNPQSGSTGFFNRWLCTPQNNQLQCHPAPDEDFDYAIQIQNYKQYPKAVAVGVIGGPCSSDDRVLLSAGVPDGTKLTIGLFDNTKCTGEPLLSTQLLVSGKVLLKEKLPWATLWETQDGIINSWLCTPQNNQLQCHPDPNPTYPYLIQIQNYKQYPKAVAVGVIGEPCDSDLVSINNNQITFLDSNMENSVLDGTKLTVGLFDNAKCTGKPLLSTQLLVSDKVLSTSSLMGDIRNSWLCTPQNNQLQCTPHIDLRTFLPHLPNLPHNTLSTKP